MAIHDLIFDMGNVLIQFDPAVFLRRLALSPSDSELLMREVFRSLEWAMLDRGTLAEEEAAERVCRRLPIHLHQAAKKLFLEWDQPLMEVAGMPDLIRELKQAGYGLYLLSNASRRQHDYWPRFSASSCFDGTLISGDLHLVKPQPEIFTKLLEQFSLRGEACFFVDDSPANVEAALCQGIRGTVFHQDVPALRHALWQAGIQIREN